MSFLIQNDPFLQDFVAQTVSLRSYKHNLTDCATMRQLKLSIVKVFLQSELHSTQHLYEGCQQQPTYSIRFVLRHPL